MIAGTSTHDRPFPGMRPFEPGESDLFYGQDSHISALLKRLGNSRLIAVFGESGCGKSSIVKAGLIPRLLGSRVGPEESLWRVAISRPATAPIRQLAEAVSRSIAPTLTAGAVEETLRSSSWGLLDVVKRAQLAQGRRVLIVIDQFEELFRFSRETDDRVGKQDEAALFVKLLLAATNLDACIASGVPVYIVLTMRSEYLGECARFFGLAEAVNDGAYLLPKMSRANIETAIVGPAQNFGAQIDNHLLQCLLNETEAAQQDGLPLLQHALRRIWDIASLRSGPVRLTVDDFESVADSGRDSLLLERHLNSHLDDVWTSLPPARRRTAERIFKQLGEYDTKHRLIRRSCDLAAVAESCGVDVHEALAVVNVFRDDTLGRTFLMPPASRTEALLKGEEPLDISHEALLRHWAKLRRWMDEEAKDADEFRLLADRANQNGAIRGLELARALEWKKTVAPTEAWSRRYRGTWDPERKRHRYHFGAAMRHLDRSRRRRQLWGLGAAAAVLAVFVAVLWGLVLSAEANRERVEAARQRAYQQDLAKVNSALKIAVSDLQATQGELKTERDDLQLVNERLQQVTLDLAGRNNELRESQNDLTRQIAETQAAAALAKQRLAEVEEEKVRYDAVNKSLTDANRQLEEQRQRSEAADRRRAADQQFRLWASLPASGVTAQFRTHFSDVLAASRAYAAEHRELPYDGLYSIRRAAAASFLSATADVTFRSPVLFAMPDPAQPQKVIAIQQGATLTGQLTADPAAWSIQRTSTIPGTGTAVVGGPGGWVALRQQGESQPTLRKFHPFAVTGLGFSTDGEWVATASASGDMRLLRRSDVARGSKIGQLASRSIMTGKLVTYMLLQKYKGDYAVREFALSVAPHEGRRPERDDVTVIALTQADRLLVWRTPGPIGKQITGVDQLEIRGRFAAIATDPSSQLVWAARVGSPQSSSPRPAQATELGPLQPGASSAIAFTACDALSDGRSVTMISWNGDGTRLAVGSDDGTVRVLERTGPGPCSLDTLVELPAHDASITTVTWHQGDVLATGAADGSARLWNLNLTPEDRTLLAALRRLDDDTASYEPTFKLLTARLGKL